MLKNRWNDQVASNIEEDLDRRVYTSRLIGEDKNLVLQGGGNTSVKIDGVLYVKGSGWNLATIEKEGFAPVKLEALLAMAKKEHLSDSEMVRLQREALVRKDAPNPSVEAILHAIIPYKFVDHTHANSVVTISNSLHGERILRELYPDYLIIPYVMPGFELARYIYEKTRDFDWQKCGGIILLHHGIFTFANSAKESYEKMIEGVNRAEKFLEAYEEPIPPQKPKKEYDLQKLRSILSQKKGYEVTLLPNQSDLAISYASQPNLRSFATRGVLTPEHIIRTKREPLVLENEEYEEAIEEYIQRYIAYFERYATHERMLDPAPNYIVCKDFGVVSVGKDEKEAKIIDEIVEATMQAVILADRLGGYRSLSEKESFSMEYWELEQAKLRK